MSHRELMQRMFALQPTIRVRLTAVYIGLFFLAGAVLIAINYMLVAQTAYSPVSPTPIASSVPKPVVTSPDAGSRRSYVITLGQGQALEQQLRDRLRNQAMGRMLTQSLFALGIAALMSVLLGSLAAGRALRPIQSILAAARRAAEGNLRERVDHGGPKDELKELADTFDGMLDRLEATFENQRRFVADVSHELRTPLSITRTAVDVTLDAPSCDRNALLEMGAEVRDAIDRAEQLIDSLLMLARSEEHVEAGDVIDLADAVQDALDDTARERKMLGLRVELALDEALTIGDRALLERAVANLVENGIRHNVPGGWLSIRAWRDRSRAWVRIANSGSMISEDVVPALFERFRRLGESRTGSQSGAGLGLSIVRAVAVGHGGDVAARPLPQGGLEVTLSLPEAAGELPAGTMDRPLMERGSVPSG